MRRTTIAFWVAPLWVPGVFWGWAAFSRQPTIGFSDMVTSIVTFFAYVGTAFVGLPTFLVMRARNWTSLTAATIVGAAIGLFASYFGLVLVLLSRGPGFVTWFAFREALDPILAVCAVLGVLVSATFWAIVRPDRSAPGS